MVLVVVVLARMIHQSFYQFLAPIIDELLGSGIHAFVPRYEIFSSDAFCPFLIVSRHLGSHRSPLVGISLRLRHVTSLHLTAGEHFGKIAKALKAGKAATA